MRVLVFGDSNSWGILADGSGLRCEDRWPVIVAKTHGWDVVEDALPGRTTQLDDPEMAEDRWDAATWNGLRHIESVLLSASPIDLVLVMLGTNDLKQRFDPSADKIADGLSRIVEKIRNLPAGPGPWRDAPPPKVAVICPPPLGEVVDDPEWDRAAEWAGSRKISQQLFKVVSQRLDVPVFDAGTAAKGSPRDPIHFEAEDQRALGRAISDWLSADGLTDG